jgi:hypothetical protein
MNNGILSLGLLTLMAACGGGDFVQIERHGRPAINEGLVLTNSLLNAFNSVGPADDLSTTAADVVTEAGAVLTAVAAVGVVAGTIPYTDPVTGELVSTAAAHVSKVVNGFLPDVLRVNTAVTLATSATSYANTTTGCIGVITSGGVAGIILSCGRKLKDDVIDITFNYLAGGVPAVLSPVAALKDDVTYDEADDSTNVASSRSAVQSSFPFIAKPY